MTKNILIFSDGTGQAGGLLVEERRSNIYKLYRATRCGPDSCINPAEQVAFYDAGLGSRPTSGGLIRSFCRGFHNFLSQATGFGLSTNIIDCYEMIIRLWRPGDRIFLLGFSRGAYTARCVGAVLALCGVPTQLERGAAMKYDSGTARRLAKIGVKTVYQHTASKNPAKASARENELLAQRQELARQFRERYASRQPDKSDYPYFIGVFDTVAAVASTGALITLAGVLLALTAVAAAVLWYFHPAYSPWFGNTVGDTLSVAFGLVALDTSNWNDWFLFVAGIIALITLIWFLKEHIKFAPKANPRKAWRTFTMSFGRMRFEDISLNDNVKYARHAIAIDENRSSFTRVGWGDPKSTRPYQDEDGFITFRQYWFSGNHSDIGGSYPENESRLSDIALKWMADDASAVRNGIKIDHSFLQLYPDAGGIQHDERKAGFPVLTKWLRFTWRERLRKIPNPKTTLHDSVYERFKLTDAAQYDAAARYRPEVLRTHEKLTDYYKDIPAPPERKGLRAFVRGFFLPR
jgi:uncharacterized protein (DUF2235 family)